MIGSCAKMWGLRLHHTDPGDRKNPFLLLAAKVLVLMAGLGISGPMLAEPWIEVGDRTIRNDVEVLQAYGLIEGPLTTWPVPAGELSSLADDPRLAEAPDFVRLSAQRVLARLLGEGQPQGWVKEAHLGLTNGPDLIRDFGDSARQRLNGEAGLIYDSEHISTGIRISSEPDDNERNTRVGFDGSYLDGLIGNWQLYGGWIDKWYGPGWTSSLTLSNNARPVPKVGLMRNSPHAFETKWLSWLGAWQFDTFVGVLDDSRKDRNTILAGVRGSFMPIEHLEVGITRLSMLCGENHPCNPITGELHVQNSQSNPSPVHDQGTVDIKYNIAKGSLQWSPYVQIMNRDNGPFVHAAASYLAGTSVGGPLGEGGGQWRMIAEYADTVATQNWFDFGKKQYGVTYNDYKYTDGNHYHGRTLGFSLDTDSRLFSLTDLFVDSTGRSYRFTYYRADINVAPPGTTAPDGSPSNKISTQAAKIDQFELGFTQPWRVLQFNISVRAQDAQPYPEAGGKISGELDISYRF